MKQLLESIVNENFVNQTEKQYHIEAQVQQKIGIEIFKRTYTNEKPIEPTLEYRFTNETRNTNEYIDIFFSYEKLKMGIELKYKTSAKNETSYIQQGAQNNGKYDFIKDIYRLEKAKENGIIDKGFALLLTNDKSYWTAARKGSSVKAFDLLANTCTKEKYIPKWKDRKETLKLNNQYQITWLPDKSVGGGYTFLYLIVEI
ncbi:hypothetical protein MASR2M29_16970 [Spirochaetota bacterium]